MILARGNTQAVGRCTLCFLAALACDLSAQEAPLTASATQPSKGTFLIKQQVRYYYGQEPENNQLSIPFSISTGVERSHSFSVTGSGNFSEAGEGLSDISLFWKWRFHSKDINALDTSRTALIAGIQIPSGTGGWGTGSFNPSIGLAHTSILGRLGLGAGIEYKINTGSGAEYDVSGVNSSYDALSGVLSVLWRVAPASYTSQTKGAWYAGFEGEAIQSGPGTSIRIGPAVMYEADIWVFEAGYQFYPVNTGQMDNINGMVFVGLRLFF